RAVYNEPLAYIKPISATKMSMLIGEELSQIKDSTQRKCMNILLKESRELLIVSRLVKLFRAMIKNRKGNMKRWIDFVQKSRYKLSGLKSLARGLKNDLAAVTNAIKWSWNNGPVEGHVNRIKNIKRQMYGRASFELLRKKVILSQTG
ncbi:transposase, partial [Galbibacter sp.]